MTQGDDSGSQRSLSPAALEHLTQTGQTDASKRGTQEYGNSRVTAMVAESSREYRFIQELLRLEAGIVIEREKRYLVETRMAALARAEAVSLKSLFEMAFAGHRRIRRKMIEAMTTNETSFFRDAGIFTSLLQEVIPHLLRNIEGPIRVWCGACSTGQEPYSLAMGLIKSYPREASRFRILATDIDTQALMRAKRGDYSQLEVNRGLPAVNLVRFFENRDLRWYVRDEVRNMIEFRQMNLARPFSDVGRQDLVLLRNVLIYFDVETKADILRRIGRVLSPQGLLVLGGTESLLGQQVPLQSKKFGRCVTYSLRDNNGE